MTEATIDPSAWIRRFHPAPDAPVQLVCFPHAGGASTYYFPVSRALWPGTEVLGVQYPGRQDRRTEPPICDLGQLADHVTIALQGFLGRPVALFGHSLGAMVAFEVARRLERDGHEPVVLFASGRRAPSTRRTEAVHTYDDARLLANLRAMSGTDSRLLDDDEFVRGVLPVLRSDYQAAETYRFEPGPPLRCPIVTLAGTADPMVTLAEAEAWREHTTGSFRLESFPGGHFYLDQQHRPVQALITSTIAAELRPTLPA